MATLQKSERIKAIRNGEPVELMGLTFYPITMENYEQYLLCREGLTVRQSSLPAKYAFSDYLSALWDMEYDAIEENTARSGLFIRALKFLYMALRIDIDGEKMLGSLRFNENNGRLVLARIIIVQGDEKIEIAPQDFSNRIRQLLAEQNGFELPNESENAEIIEANEKLKELKNGENKTKFDVETLIASVAYLSHLRDKDIKEWTVREFELRKDAIDREKRYMLYGQAEIGGVVQFKNGNPCPSWCFNTYDESYGTVSYEKLKEGFNGAISEKL